MRRAALIVLVAVGLLAGAVSCSPVRKDRSLPDGVTVDIDQSRMLRKTRTLFLRIHNGSAEPMRVTEFTLTSSRFDDVTWSGPEEIGPGYDADLEFEMPPGRCGAEGVDATVVLQYDVADQPVRSVVRPDDPYGAAGAFLDRDCAQETLREAAAFELGEIRVEGSGRSAVLDLPIIVTPTGRRDDVVLTGFGSTVLFVVRSDPAIGSGLPVRGRPVTIDLRLVPQRCDSHALAEDKVGTLIPVGLRADDLDETSFYVPIGPRRRSVMLAYVAEACGFPTR